VSDRRERILAALATLQATQLELLDESHRHAGHEGARDGRGHYALDITSEAFAGLLPLARHRRVYQALGELMQTDIHALTIRARTPSEAA
jgi:BolA protein